MQTWESLDARPVPEWYDDAKLGLLITWGPYAVPAWAPASGDFADLVAENGLDHALAHDPRAEWYENSMQLSASPTHEHHRSAWGRLTRYESFGRSFRQGLKEWDAEPWAETAAACGARYVVFSAKHHDGFLLWPSRRRNPRRRGWQTTHDVVGDLAAAVRRRGMKFGLYYSAGLDWTFGGLPIRNLKDLVDAVPRGSAYASYVDAHMRELISRYQPSILWNDVCSPAEQDLLSLFSSYFDEVPDGVVNDRFGQAEPGGPANIFRRALEAVRSLFPSRAVSPRGAVSPEPRHMGFRTIEEGPLPEDEEGKWEKVRAVGHSIGCNIAEGDESLLTVPRLVHLLVDVVARGGNLLLGVGPGADGALLPPVVERLHGLGDWLKRNGEAIYRTRPWEIAEAVTDDGIEVRYMRKGMTLYAILLGTPAGRAFLLPSLRLAQHASLRVLGSLGYAAWFQEGRDIHVRLSEPLRESPAHVISMTPVPRIP